MSRPEFSSSSWRPSDSALNTEANFKSTIDDGTVADGAATITATAVDELSAPHMFHSAQLSLINGTYSPDVLLYVVLLDSGGTPIFRRWANASQCPIDPNNPIPIPEVGLWSTKLVTTRGRASTTS